MKHRRTATAILCTSLMLGIGFLSGCGSDEPPELEIKECSHTDENHDKQCDKCGNEYYIPCTKHADTDGDAKCDFCGKTMTPTADEPESPEENPENPQDSPSIDDKPESPEDTPSTDDKPQIPENTPNNPEDAPSTDDKPQIPEDTPNNPEDAPSTDDDPVGLELITDSTANFNFIYENGISSSIIKAIDDLIADLEKLGLKAKKFNASSMPNDEKHAIIIGNIADSCYEYDIYSLGPDGYAVRVLSDAVQIIGGSEDALSDAIKVFKKDFLGISKKTSKITELTLTEDMTLLAPQTDFPIESVSIMGEDARRFAISLSEDNAQMRAFAEALRSYLYDRAGYYLNITVADAGEHEIRINLNERSGGEGLRIYTSGSSLIIECEFPNKLQDVAMKYFAPNKDNKINFDNGFSVNENVRDIYYADYGAVGDGNTNDFAALYAAHVYANEWGHTVVADNNATYYISSAFTAIPIKTDVNFGDAKFIIDDSWINPENSERTLNIFAVTSDTQSFSVIPSETGAGAAILAINAEGGIKADSFTRLDLGLGYPAMLILRNHNHKNYIRFGPNENDGSYQAELIIVDANGYVNKDTPLLFDYELVTEVTVLPIDDKEITITGGHFTTIANKAPSSYTYYKRGIEIKRHNTHIIGLTHVVEGEGDTGAPYNGFITISNTNNVLVENCTLVGHKAYKNESGVSMGTYDIGVSYSNNTVFRGCVQSNFFYNEEEKITSMSKGYWGISGTNFSKNLTYDSCRLTRYDAHCGVYNANIIDSEVATITLIGGGCAKIENTKVYTDSGSTLITLRNDYGSTWHGDLIIKNVKMIPSSDKASVNILSGNWYNHYFGYTTYLPENITIDNFTANGAKTVNIFGGSLAYLNDISREELDGTKNLNPYMPTKKVEILSNPDGLNYAIPTSEFYKNTVIIGN